MKTNKFGRRDFIKYGLISSCFILSGCSIYREKLALRGVPNTFPSEFIDSLSTGWEFIPIKNIGSIKNNPYNSVLQEKTDLIVLNDGWVSDLPFDSLKEIKTNNIRNKLSKQAISFLDGLGEDFEKRVLPLAVSPWVILFRNEDSLRLKNTNSWEVVFSSSLKDQIVFPNSPYLLSSIARKIGFVDALSKIKSQARTFDDRNALNWLVSGRANAAVLPLSSCVDSLIQDPRLSVLLPMEGSPLNWTIIASPSKSKEPFPTDWFDLLWGSIYSKSIIRKGYLPPTNLSDFRKENIKISQRYQSAFLPDETVWNNCWSLPKLTVQDKKKLADNWNNI
tara:strand:- start:532 stop:1536 length:1005 start_codon:yes stop_codon:yes gene_type:complete